MTTQGLRFTQAPPIETERLRLRAHCLGDFAASVAIWADPVVVRHTIGKPSTEQATWFRLLRYAGHWSILGYGYWAVEDKATGAFIGEVGFADFKRDIKPSIEGIPEVGWVLSTEHHGKGYATEALEAALHWSDAHLANERTVCIITPANSASIRVAEKCGFEEYARTDPGEMQTIFFERNHRHLDLHEVDLRHRTRQKI